MKQQQPSRMTINQLYGYKNRTCVAPVWDERSRQVSMRKTIIQTINDAEIFNQLITVAETNQIRKRKTR